ncbi:IS66 family transposase [Salinispira pacifica]|uniref:Mobile element protein n=1 Tax=Salinispira pacifica TaxID=1307761 RepID=V5WF35_9SPIO|nr:transposase [Salinispira pacifica]AHC13786.1 Mobile element protein [Salinispira pacifica]
MDIATLPTDVQQYIRSLETDNRHWEAKYSALEEEHKLLLLQKFGRTSEKESDSTQPLPFDETDSSAAEDPFDEDEQAQSTVRSHTRKKSGRKAIDDSLHREEVIIDISEEEKSCACGSRMVKIGEEVSEKLHVIPPKMWVERIIRPKYACHVCEGSGDEDKPAIRIAPVQPAIIDKSIVTPALLAFLIVNKFVDHLPYYRQESRFERIGIHISRQNMSHWQNSAYKRIKPLIRLHKKHIKTGQVMHMAWL